MNNNELISIIVPIYNVEKYLEKCVNSILNQTFKNIEILLIDDGSIDNSAVICDNFKKLDKRVKVFHKKNSGLSETRNFGIKKAKGKYLSFIDADDFIENEMLEKLYIAIKRNKSDIACCGKSLDYKKNNILINNKKNFTINSKEALEKLLLKDDLDSSACDKLFDISLFKDVFFPLGHYYEDIATVYKLLLKSNKITHIDYVGYHYVNRNNSISNEKFNKKHFDFLYYTKVMIDDIINIFPDLENQANSFYYLELISTLRRIKCSTNFSTYKEEYEIIKKEYNKIFYDFLKNKYINYFKKIMGILIRFNLYHITEFLYNMISKKK